MKGKTPRWKLKFKCAAKNCTKTITGPDSYRLHLIDTHDWKPERAKAQRDKQAQKPKVAARKTGQPRVSKQPAASVNPAA